MDTLALDRDHALRFLTTMFLGQPGLLQLCSTGNWAGAFFPTTTDGIDQAVAYAAQLDRGRPQGIYFRATTLKAHPGRDDHGKPRRGAAADTLAVPMLWADLDYGTAGHKGANLPPTAEDAQALVAESGLPDPTVWIHSGGGLYPLWTPSTTLGVDEAAKRSVDVQAAILGASQAHGWEYGTGVSDLARVLRLPGSVNRKTDTDRPCLVTGGTSQPVDVAAFPEPLPVTPVAGVTGGAARPLPERRPVDPNRARGPFDVIADTCTWSDILAPAGWTLVGIESDGAERWLRPGGSDSEYSARAFEHNLVCHSESAGLPSGAGQRLTKGRVYAYLWHGGDLTAATVDLLRGGNAGGLPVRVLDDIAELRADPFAGILVPTISGTFATGATDDELGTFLTTYTRYNRPDRLGRRTTWMQGDPPARLGWHARALVEDVLSGHYPADRALRALNGAYRHHGGQDPAGARNLLSVALGAILNAKVSA